MKSTLLRATAVAAVLGLGACETFDRDKSAAVVDPANVATETSHERFPIAVANAKEEMTLTVEPHVFALAADDKKKVAWFAETYKHVGHGAIWVTAPVGSDNAAASIGAAAEIASVMMNRGIDPRDIKMHSYEADAGDTAAPMTISYKRYHAYTAECGNWSGSMTFTPSNQPTRNFGCASQSNLAALVEDPHDLKKPRDLDPSDASRRSTVFDRYRQGESTTSERTEAESGLTSNVME